MNFNQKKVNKSLFYDIYGIVAPDVDGGTIPRQNEIYLSHQLVKFLNSNDSSPFKGFIKMLGTGKGYVSQAFLVEQFLRHLSPNGIWSDIAEDLKLGSPKKLHNYAASELSSYLGAIKFNFKDYWPDGESDAPSVLCKTTGIGAIMRFLADLHNNMPDDLSRSLKEKPSDIIFYAELVTYFNKNVKLLSSEGKRFFSTGDDGEYNGTGGAGLQVKLYREMVDCWKKKMQSM